MEAQKFSLKKDDLKHKNDNILRSEALVKLGNKIPPHSLEAEIAVLGSMMLSRKATSAVIEMIGAEAFYSDVHKTIFEVINSMYDRGIPVDIVTLSEELKKVGKLEYVGGVSYITQINIKTPSAANVENYALLVLEKFLKRNLIDISGKILSNAYDDANDVLEEIDRAEAEIFQLAEKRFTKSYTSTKQLSRDIYEKISLLRDQGAKAVTGVSTGLIDLDKIIHGFQKSDLIILAARPSMGKTALALSFARTAATREKKPVAFFSLEMANEQIMMRLLSAEAEVQMNNIRTGHISSSDDAKIIDALGRLTHANLFIDDTAMLSIREMRAKCRRLKAEHKIELVVVDYLQLLTDKSADNREREISIISQTLKQIAKEMELPVVALAQLNRSVDSRPDKKPMLSDLRESGSIEQDADIVMFVHRPEYYGIDKYADDPNVPVQNTAEIIIAKHRNGATGSVKVAFLKDIARFENLEVGYEDQPQTMRREFDNHDSPGF